MSSITANESRNNFKRFIRSRLFPLGLIAFSLFLVLAVRLFQLQIIEGAVKQEQYISQKTQKTISLSSTRGIIYDRNGNVLAGNKLIYVVNVTDNGDYKDGYEKNNMLLKLIDILDRHDTAVNTFLPIVLNPDGTFDYTCSESARLRFLRDMYGLRSVEELKEDTSGKTDANLSAEGVFQYLFKRYGVGYRNSRKRETYEIDNETALKLINIRYGMAQNSYRRYVPTAVASDIDQETMADVMEHSETMLGVTVDEDYRRVYTNSKVFSQLLGYTGAISTEQVEALNGQLGYDKYSAGDVVGQSGLEAVLELDLQGEKGEQTMFLDSLGHILEVTESRNAKAGEDYYLTVDKDLSVAIYNLIEQKLAGIILGKLVDRKVRITTSMNNADRLISSYSVYNQFIANNLLDLDFIEGAQDGTAGHRVYEAWKSGQSRVLGELKRELESTEPTAYKNLDSERGDGEHFMQTYMSRLYSVLVEKEYLVIDQAAQEDSVYKDYFTDEAIGLGEFLRYAITKSWVNTSMLELKKIYSSTEETYAALIQAALGLLADDSGFIKAVYKNMIWDGDISPCDLCLTLLDQGLVNDDKLRPALESSRQGAAFSFISKHIKDLSLSPAMLALDPCTASVTVTDVHTGDVLACVAYPGYDNNRLSGRIETAYYNKLINDSSNPLYNSATLAQTAPGSVFKPCTAFAALNTGVVEPDELIETKGQYVNFGLHMNCWIFSTLGTTHGKETTADALRDSCNYYFSVMGERLSTLSGSYSESGGLEILNKYAKALGLGDKTGIEINEREPHLSDTSPIPSAIGQGTYLFSNVQLARYLDTLASRGKVHELTLLGSRRNSDGDILEEYDAEETGSCSFSDESWNTVLSGMRKVVKEGSISSYFTGNVEVAGKTGSAEENKLRPNHANFISFAPYSDPEIGVTVSIPYGYTSANAVDIASRVYEYYYGFLSLDEITGSEATLKETYYED